ncbi:MAG: hypothetical protein WCX71_01540 [Candidatus Buchananbacteria bacterium]
MNQKWCLASVTDKTGLPEFAAFLSKRGWKFISTGGTATCLKGVAGVEVVEMADWLTKSFVVQTQHADILDPNLSVEDAIKMVASNLGFGEMFGGRVKSLSREKSAALLSKSLSEDQATFARLGIEPIDMLIVNYYTLNAATQESNATIYSVIEKMDIGGPTATLEAIKGDRIVLCQPTDYATVKINMVANNADDITPALRAHLRRTAARLVASYYQPLADFLESK